MGKPGGNGGAMAQGERTEAPAGEAAPPDSLRSLDSQDLLAGRREVLIRHGAETYRLRLTSNNKLILMK
jgi:hemin uptake protein HemP